MKYSVETLQKYSTAIKNKIAEYANVAATGLKVSISKGNQKIGKVMNVSLAPIVTCHNCKECKHLCYDIKACLFRKQVMAARARNTYLAVNCPDMYFSQIEQAIARRKTNKFFRWHVGGDILNYNYFCHMVEIARKHSDFVFWTYTKCYHFVNRYVSENGGSIAAAIPGNMVVMFSEWDGMPMINPFGFPEFSCKLADGNKNHDASYFNNLYRCPGNCDVCKVLHRGCIAGETTYADEH